jgi:hypothetical protein
MKCLDCGKAIKPSDVVLWQLMPDCPALTLCYACARAREISPKVSADREHRREAAKKLELEFVNRTSPVHIADITHTIGFGTTYLWRDYNEKLGHTVLAEGSNERGAYTLYNDGIAILRGYAASAAPLVKVTAGKPKLAFTFRSTMEAIAAVREYATNGPYKDPDNWKEVADSDWDESLLRHVMAYLEAKRDKGSVYDVLSHLHHIAHVLTISGFIIENHTHRDGLTIKEEMK